MTWRPQRGSGRALTCGARAGVRTAVGERAPCAGTHVGSVGGVQVHQNVLLAVADYHSVLARQDQRQAFGEKRHVVVDVAAQAQLGQPRAAERLLLQERPERHLARQERVLVLGYAAQHGGRSGAENGKRALRRGGTRHAIGPFYDTRDLLLRLTKY